MTKEKKCWKYLVTFFFEVAYVWPFRPYAPDNRPVASRELSLLKWRLLLSTSLQNSKRLKMNGYLKKNKKKKTKETKPEESLGQIILQYSSKLLNNQK